jgi:Ferric reductase like transmembrane component
MAIRSQVVGGAGPGVGTEPLRSLGLFRATAPRSLRSRRAAQALLLALALLAALPPVLAFLRPRSGDPFPYEFGRGAALLAFELVALQVVLAARCPFADRAVGIAAVMWLHRAVGVLTLALLLAHPAMILVGARGQIPWEWPVAVGAGALFVLVLGVLAALLFRCLRLDYNRWRTLHKVMILVVVLGYVHSRAVGHDLQSSPALRAWWTALLAVAVTTRPSDGAYTTLRLMFFLQEPSRPRPCNTTPGAESRFAPTGIRSAFCQLFLDGREKTRRVSPDGPLTTGSPWRIVAAASARSSSRAL